MLRPFACILLVALPIACTRSRPPSASRADATTEARPGSWAKPLAVPGVPNLFRVSDVYYRGAQPTSEGLRGLQKLGVRTIVNLRTMHSDDDDVTGVSLAYKRIRFTAWHPEHEDVVQFLKIVTAPANQPVFVHCRFGADRTGMMTATYRIVVQGWSKEAAIREMTQGGFGFHPEWQNLVHFVRELDVDGLRREAGVPAPAAVDAR